MLDSTKLKTELQKLMEECSNCHEDAASKWANAISFYTIDIEPDSKTIVQATKILENELINAFDFSKSTLISKSLPSQDRALEIENAFSNYANLISSGIDNIYISNPPNVLVGFENLFTLPYPKTHMEASDRFATAIDSWMKTGVATLVSTGAIVNWS